MPGSYTFWTDPRRGLLRIKFSGFFALDDLVGYVEAKDEAIARLGCPPNQHLTLCDFTACIPQSQAVLDLFRRSLDDPTARSRRLAVVVGSSLAGLQAQRVVTRSDAAVFDGVAAAERWLFADDRHRTAGTD